MKEHIISAVALLLSVAATPAYAEWVTLRGGEITVWRTSGVLFQFRVVQIMADNRLIHTDMYDCRTRNRAIIASTKVGETEDVVVNSAWEPVRPNTVGEYVLNWSCNATYRPQPKNRWLDPPPESPIGSPLLWSAYSRGPNNFRMAYVHDDIMGTELWVLNCPQRAVKVISEDTPDKAKLVNDNWRFSPPGSGNAFATFCEKPSL